MGKVQIYRLRFRRNSKEKYWNVEDRLTESTMDIVIGEIKKLYKITDARTIEIVMEKVE